MYKVLIDFTDNKDGGVYRAGNDYPHKDANPNQERIDFLLSNRTTFGEPVIAVVSEGADGQEKSLSKMKKPELEEYAKSKDIDLTGLGTVKEYLEAIQKSEGADGQEA